MICPKCKTDNESAALFCRSCGSKLIQDSTPSKPMKTTKQKVFHVLFCIAAIVFAYSLISILFPLKDLQFFPGIGGSESHYSTYYSDIFGFNREGASHYREEWLPAVLISGVFTFIFYRLKKK